MDRQAVIRPTRPAAAAGLRLTFSCRVTTAYARRLHTAAQPSQPDSEPCAAPGCETPLLARVLPGSLERGAASKRARRAFLHYNQHVGGGTLDVTAAAVRKERPMHSDYIQPTGGQPTIEEVEQAWRDSMGLVPDEPVQVAAREIDEETA